MFILSCDVRYKVLILKQLTKVRCLSKYHNLSYIHRLGKEPLRALTLGQLLETKSNQYGDRTALISKHQKKKFSFLDILDKSDRLAAGFRKIGLNHGEKVGIWAPNMVEWYLTHMACARAGLVLVCVNPALQAKEIEYCINKVEMKAVVCTDTFKTQNYYEILNTVASEISKSDPGKLKSKAIPSLKSVIIATEDNHREFRGAFNFDEILNLSNPEGINQIKGNQHLIQPDDICHIQFTSGTTGKPKAPMSTHFHLVNNSYQFGVRNLMNTKTHRICSMVPFFHVFGTDGTICNSLNHGATIVIPSPSFSADKCLDAIAEEKCTVVHGTPTMYIDLLEQQKRRKEDVNLDVIVVGAAPATPQLINDLEEHLKVKKINVGYGMSECTSATFQGLPEDPNDIVIDTVGVLYDHLEAKVVDESGKIVPRGVAGELCIRGYSTTIGYCNDKEKTRELIASDRWLRTGDRFIIKEDGYGVIVGRLKDMILRGGENIYPKEIEELLATHPAVLECHVIGLPQERLGEEVCACVRLVKGASLTLEEVKKFCESDLAKFKIPSVLKIVEDFPKTASGKIQKFRLVEMFCKNKSK